MGVPGPATISVLVTRPSPAGVNMPAMTVMPASVAIRRTPSAHGPSVGSAIGASGTPNWHMVASGNTTSVAPASAAWRVYSRTTCRFAAGSLPLRICANAIRMSASLGAVTMRRVRREEAGSSA